MVRDSKSERQPPCSRVLSPLMNPIQKAFIAMHVFFFRATSGGMGSSMGGQKVVLLTTKGNKSGKERTVPLMCFDDGGSSFIIASAGGSPANPAWFKNIQSDPNVTVAAPTQSLYQGPSYWYGY